MANGYPVQAGDKGEQPSVKLSGLGTQKPVSARKMFKKFTPSRALGNPSAGKSLKTESFTRSLRIKKP